ncbi:uncharacterized protein ASPGLDRAFT_34258 [Aspergillus glaucus CBS 516.65]|uniref:Uncharacterized protein n=1 Tax=Aspergillus glaucus CBS 516.65 TaxID=1160497 RepID=A0A1L9VNK1_ASPGL|nr:hypothetical protein ASPGLDRAFT_34258 [Aspergillus glaucus CBS 516.65]OJJ85460.1 hypothetical protein ASPGLDRAFT_34258 [Aspergillus glaucus CBS 516.65]
MEKEKTKQDSHDSQTPTSSSNTTSHQPLKDKNKDAQLSRKGEIERESKRRYLEPSEELWKRLEEAIPGYTTKCISPLPEDFVAEWMAEMECDPDDDGSSSSNGTDDK